MKTYRILVENERTEKIQPESFRLKKKARDKVVQFGHNRNDNTTVNECEDIISLIKSTSFNEINDDSKIMEVLKGGCFVRKVTTTEYLIVDGEGKNLIGKIDDDYVSYLANYEDKYEYIRKGDQIDKVKIK